MRERTGGRCWIASVECSEHGADSSAIRRHPEKRLRGLSAEALGRLAGEAA